MLEWWHRASLRVHLLVQLSFALGIILLVFLYTSTQTVNESIQNALKEREILARVMANRMDDQLAQAVQVLQSAVPDLALNLEDDDLEPEKALLKNLYEHSILFKRIVLIDVSGDVLWLAPYDERRLGGNIAEPPYNRSNYRVRQPSFFPRVGIESKTPGMVLLVPITRNPDQINGYLLGWIDLGDPRASTLLYPYEPGSHGYTDLVDEKGDVIASTRPERVGQVSDHANTLATLIHDKQSAVQACHSCHAPQDLSRENVVMAFAPLTRLTWGLALHQPESEVFANTNALTYRLAALGLVVLVAFLGLVWITTRETVQPMRMLTQACQQIASGDLSQPIPRVRTAEAATLAASFEEMRQGLLTCQERTDAAQRDLEKRVEERTAELVHYRDYLLKTNRDLTALNAVSAALVHRLDLNKTLNVVLERVLEGLAADSAGIFLLDERETTLVLAAHRGVPPEIVPAINRLTFLELESPQDRALSADNLAWHSACRAALDQHFASSSILSVPLEEKGKLLGTLFAISRAPGCFTADDESLLVSIGWQVAMGVRNARLYEAVQRKEKEHVEMLHQVIAAQEDERKRIARELHDETSQGLATLMLGLDTLDAALAVDPREAAALQQTNKAIARQMLENVRRITTDLRPSLLDDMGLVAAVAWYGEKRLNPLGIRLRLQGSDLQDRRLLPDLEIALFRIIQEAITNCVRHAHASTVTVELTLQNSHVAVRISDDGRGFDAQHLQQVALQDRGLGLRGMQERASLLGGEFLLQTAPDCGTTIRVSIPMQREVRDVKDDKSARDSRAVS